MVLVIAIVSTQFQHEGETISGWVSAVMVAFTIPAILFGSIAGVYVDRWKKKTVLVSSNILRGVLVLSIPLLLWITKNSVLPWGAPTGFWGLLCITFLVSTFTQFFTPAEQSAIYERQRKISGENPPFSQWVINGVQEVPPIVDGKVSQILGSGDVKLGT